MRLVTACALLLLAAAPLRAETYKWVDEKGVTNYSNAPPPEAAAKAAPIEERVSTLPTDPAFVQEVAAMRARALRRAELEETEWLQRQQILAAAAAAPAPSNGCGYRADCGVPFGPTYTYHPAVYAPVFTAVGFRRHAPGFKHRSIELRHRSTGPRRHAPAFRNHTPASRQHASSGRHGARTAHSGQRLR